MANGVDNVSGLTDEFSAFILDKLDPLIIIFKVVGIALLIYIIFLIIRALFKWRTMSQMVKIAKNVEQINQKLDVLIGKRGREKVLEPEKKEKVPEIKDKIEKEKIKKRKIKK